MRNIKFQKGSWDDLGWWAKNDPKMILKIWELIMASAKTPFEGIGKPEPLKSNLKGLWSRRISQEHRLIYKVDQEEIIIFAVKGHYQ